MVEAFARETLRHAAIEETTADSLRQLIVARVSDAIENAYVPGETGAITVQMIQSARALVVTIRDYGLPADTRRLDGDLHTAGPGLHKQIFGLEWARAADEVHWISYGPAGKALRLTKRLLDRDVTAHLAPKDLQPFQAAPPLAPEQDYEIRRMRPDEALQVSQLMYKAYGPSYFNADVYYPERMAALNDKGDIRSFVACGADGRLVGHYALELNQAGPVAEAGQAVVDPAHRGRRLLERLKTAAIDEARRLNLAGVYADAVTVHTFTQKSNIEHGARLACADLGIAPRAEKFVGIEHQTNVQRISCLLYFLFLKPPSPQTVFAPAVHREAMAKLYENLGCAVTFGDEQSPAGQGELTVTLDTRGAKAFLRAAQIGEDTAAAIAHAKRALIEQSHADVLFVELPLTQPGTPTVAADLAKEGFSFAGIAPCFSASGDLLRLVYFTKALAREPIQIAEDIGRWLVDYALADHARVNPEGGALVPRSAPA